MQIVHHIGAHCTDGDRLLRSLRRNVAVLSCNGVALPEPGRYRRLLRDTILTLGGRMPAPGTREILLGAILDDALRDNATPERLVFSNADFICVPTRVFENGEFYPTAVPKVLGLRRLFPQDTIELHLALCNPATFLPALFARVEGQSFADFLNGYDPAALRWSDLVARIKAAVPHIHLTVWCNEDTPLIWGEVLHNLAGAAAGPQIDGEFDLLAAIMAPDGLQRLMAYLEHFPPRDSAQKRLAMQAFLDRYAIDDQIDHEVDLPGWTQDMVDRLTATYERDVRRIAQMKGVTFIAP